MALGFITRSMVASIFVAGGADSAKEPGPRADMAQQFMSKLNVNLDDEESATLVKTNGALQVLGGVAMSLGIFPRLAALGLFGSLAATTAAGHPFWAVKDAGERQGQLTQFLKNLGLAGALLAIAFGPSKKASTKK